MGHFLRPATWVAISLLAIVSGACAPRQNAAPAAAIIRLWMQQYFSRITATAIDPLALALGLGPLVIAAAIACYLPARRAAKVE